MILIEATMENQSGFRFGIHHPSSLPIKEIPITQEEEVMIFEELEKIYPDSVPVKIDGVYLCD